MLRGIGTVPIAPAALSDRPCREDLSDFAQGGADVVCTA
jgi:hypothetical protein